MKKDKIREVKKILLPKNEWNIDSKEIEITPFVKGISCGSKFSPQPDWKELRDEYIINRGEKYK